MNVTRWSVSAGMVLAVLAGCDNAKPNPASSASTPTSQGTPLAASPPTRWPAPRNYVLEPDLAPEEKDAADPEYRQKNHLPRRIITLAPNLTETVFALGLGDFLIGRDPYSIFPPSVQRLPDCGGLLDRSVERIVQLAPDLVLTVKSDVRLAEKLAAHNIRALALPDDSLAEIYAGLRGAGEALGRPKTMERLIAHLQEDLQRIATLGRRSIPAGLRVVYVSDGFAPPPAQNYFAGTKSCIGEFLGLLGATPAVVPAETAYVPMSLEQIIAADPQVIVEMRLGQEITPALRDKALAVWGTVGQISAVKDRRIVLLNHPAMLVPGPRINLAFQELAQGLADLFTR